MALCVIIRGFVCNNTFNGKELATILEFMAEGDSLTVHKLDRLGRNTRDVLNLVHTLTEKGPLRGGVGEYTLMLDLGAVVCTRNHTEKSETALELFRCCIVSAHTLHADFSGRTKLPTSFRASEIDDAGFVQTLHAYFFNILGEWHRPISHFYRGADKAVSFAPVECFVGASSVRPYCFSQFAVECV